VLNDRRSDDKEKLLVFSDLHCIFQRTNATAVCLHESYFRSAEFLLDNSKQNLNLFRDLFACCELQILLVMLLAIPNWQDISHYSCLSVETNFLFLFFQTKDLCTSYKFVQDLSMLCLRREFVTFVKVKYCAVPPGVTD